MSSARVLRGLEGTLFLVLVTPLLAEWFETTSGSSRLSYALLVPALAAFLALREIRRTPASGSTLSPGGADSFRVADSVPWALLTAFAFLAGSFSGVFTLSLLALPLAAVAATARFAGRAGLRRFAPALGLLFLMVPPPMPLLDRINPFLVEASGQTAAALLRPFDAGVSWVGSTLSFRGWRLIVAEVCSGSGTFLMLGALCAFLAALFRLRLAPAVFLLLAVLPITLLVNGARIASSAGVIDTFGAAAGEGLPHELLGEVVVLAGVGLLVWLVEHWRPRLSEART